MCYKQEVQKKNEIALKNNVLDKLPDYVQDFLFNNISSERAKIVYSGNIRQFLEWCIDNNYIRKSNPKEVEYEDLGSLKTIVFTKYFSELQDNGIKLSTINSKIKQLKSFFKYLSYNDYIDKDYIQGISKTKFKYNNTQQVKELKLPRRAEINELIRTIKQKNKREFNKERDVTIVETFLNTGLRLSELVGLNKDDLFLDVDKPYLKVVGKGSYIEEEAEKVYLNEKIVGILKRWLFVLEFNYPDINTKALFITTKGTRITEVAINKMITVNSGGKIHPHMLRHYYATRLYNKTKNIIYVKEQLRHRSVNLTADLYASGEMKL